MAPLFEYVSQTIGIVLVYDLTSNCVVWNVTCKLDFPIIHIYEFPLNLLTILHVVLYFSHIKLHIHHEVGSIGVPFFRNI
jgi:hypothetical protein